MGTSSHAAARRRGAFTLPHSILVVGILATALTMVIGTGGAFSASTPKSGKPGEIIFYDAPGDEEPQEIESSDVAESYKTFKVRFTGEKSSESWSVTGITMIDIINQAIEDEERRAQVKSLMLRPKASGSNYAAPSVIGSYYLKASSPVMIVTESDDKDVGSHYSQLPILLPAQNDGNDNGASIVRLTKNRDLDLRAFYTEALKIKIKKKSGPNKKGNYSFSATDVDGASYDWYLYSSDGTVLETDKGRTFTTTKLSTSPASYNVAVEATAGEGDGQSFGSDTYPITTKNEDDGKTDSGDDKSGTTTGTGGSGTGTGTGTGTTSGTGSGTYKPPKYTPPKSTVPPVTPSTGASDVDNSGLSQAVAGLRGTGTARAVSGVMLSTPASTPNPAGGGEDGRALEKLAAPLADAANDVFKPIDYPDNGWMLMVAVMFAAFVLGGIKEYRNP